MKLYILHKLPTPYNDNFFRALDADQEIELQVFHLWRGSERRPWKAQLGTGYPNRYIQSRLGIDWTTLAAAVRDRDSLFMVGDWAHTEAIALLAARLAVAAPVALWVDTPQEHLQRPVLKKLLRRIFLSGLLRGVDAIFGSGAPARRVLLQMGAPAGSIIDLQFLVDLGRPAGASANLHTRERANQLRRKVGCGDDGVVFVIAGTIDLAKKAQDLGLRAFARARKESKRNIGLLIAGAGPEESTLRNLAQALGIAEVTAFLGWQEPDEMDSVYFACDVLLHPAHYDPFPLVILEAMSFGCAVVGSSNCGSVEQRVRHGENGYAFEPGDEAAATAAMLALIGDRAHLTLCGRAARETAETWPMSRGVEIVRSAMKRLISPKASTR